MKVLFVIAVAALAVADAQTKFESCSTFSSDRNDLCFKTVMEEVIVKIGPDGTNDDVTLTVCSDKDSTQCCTTPALNSVLSDDWSKDDTEKWGPSYFGSKKGQCKDMEFLVKRGLLVTLAKSNDDTLAVTSLTIDTKSKDKKNKETERFLCGPFNLGGAKNPERKQTQLCKPGPYQFMRIFDASVKIGTDGTDDDVKVTVCSDANEVCCEKKLSHTFSDDWAKGKVENWKESDFGECADMLYKVNSQPRIFVTKTGKDDLKVDSFDMQFDVIDVEPKRIKFACPGFEIKGDCKNASLCKHTFTACKMSVVGASGTASRPGAAGSSNNSTPKPKTTTTRPPFRG